MVNSSRRSSSSPADFADAAVSVGGHNLSSNQHQFDSSCDGTSLNSSLSHGCLLEPRPHHYHHPSTTRSSRLHRPFTSTSTSSSANNNLSEGLPSVITVTPVAAAPHPSPSSMKKFQQRRRPTDYTTSSTSRPTAASLLLWAEHNRAIAENRRKSIEQDEGGRLFESDMMDGGNEASRRHRRSSSASESEAHHANLHDHQQRKRLIRQQQTRHQQQPKEPRKRQQKEWRRSSLDRSEGEDDARRRHLKSGLTALKQQKDSKQRVSRHDKHHHHHPSVHDEQNLLLHHQLQRMQQQYHYQQHQQHQTPPEATPEPTYALEHPNIESTTINYHNHLPKKTKKNSHRAHRHRNKEDQGEELTRRKNATRRPPTHYEESHGDGGYEKVRHYHGGKEEDLNDKFSDRKYGTKWSPSSHKHHHLHDKKMKANKERRKSSSSNSSSTKPRRRRASTSPDSHQYHYHDRKKPTPTTLPTQKSFDLLSSLPSAFHTTSAAVGHRYRHGKKYHVPATTSLHSQASDQAVVGIGVVSLGGVPPPPSSTLSISTPTPTTPPSFYHPRKKNGKEQVNIKKSDDRIIDASSSSSSSSSSTSSSSPSSSTFSNTSLNVESSTSHSSSSVQVSVDITSSADDDDDNSNSIDEDTNSSAEQRYRQHRLEEYAGKRALRRLEQELTDHSELTNPMPNNDVASYYSSSSSLNVLDVLRRKSSNETAFMDNSSARNNGATAATSRTVHRKSFTTTSKKSHSRILDRRKFDRVPQVKKSDLIIGEYLGRGNFCDVFEVTWILPEQQVQLQQLQQQWRRHHQGQGSTQQLLQQSSNSASNNNSSGSRSSSGGGGAAGTAGAGRGHSSASTRNRSNSMHNLESSLESLALSCSNDLITLFDDSNDRLANRRSISQVRTSQSIDVGGAGLGDSGSGREEGEGGGGGWLRNPNVLALKCLRPAVRAQPRKFVIGAEDLAHETALLACLDHPNIIQLYGRAEGCFSTAFQTRPSTKNDSPNSSISGGGGGGGGVVKKKHHLTNEGYFIILDRLMSTLTDRIEEWKDECDAIKNVFSVNESNGGGETNTALLTSTLPVFPKMPPESTLREHLCKRLKVAYCIADALDYLHTSHIVFRDLKPANVGFDCNDCVKMFDFGFATSIAPLLSQPYNGYGPLTETCGTRRYMAPEVALKLGYGKEVDVYSFGMLLWEICALDRPFDSIHTVEAFHDVVVLCGKRPSLKLDPLWPSSLKRLMSQCWDTDPIERPTMGEVKISLCNVLRDVNEAIRKGNFSGGGVGKCGASRGGGGGDGGSTSNAVGAGKTVSKTLPWKQEGGNFIKKWKRRVTIT